MPITRKYKIRDGDYVFDSEAENNHIDYHADRFEENYRAEKKHFWFISRLERIIGVFNNYISIENSILEIGCGTAMIAQALKEKGYNIDISDLHRKSLQYAKQKGIEKRYQFNLFNAPFESEYDVIAMFDVFEHIDDDIKAMKNIFKILKPEGWIILTVPAHMFLWNREDRISHHKRRYNKKRLKAILKQAGFQIVYSRYIFQLIMPLLLLRKILKPDSKNEVSREEYLKSKSINRFVNSILLFLCRIEAKIHRLIPDIFGGSILLAARKNNDFREPYAYK
ncbi:MAG: class I SAM-dependent methyltransferase [Spirochaetia bacterium]|nr:class I SAM-dependent methyltransferase [Spirochaetia bacterium]